jgi:hypothetical protein
MQPDRCMGCLFELLNGTEKLACNFYFSTVRKQAQTTKLGQACHHAAQASGQTSRYNTSSDAQHAASP